MEVLCLTAAEAWSDMLIPEPFPAVRPGIGLPECWSRLPEPACFIYDICKVMELTFGLGVSWLSGRYGASAALVPVAGLATEHGSILQPEEAFSFYGWILHMARQPLFLGLYGGRKVTECHGRMKLPCGKSRLQELREGSVRAPDFNPWMSMTTARHPWEYGSWWHICWPITTSYPTITRNCS